MLLLTDRLKEGHRLRQIMDAVEPCTLVGPGQSAPASAEHGLIVCDAALDDPAALAALQAVLAHHRVDPGVPVLCLARSDGPDAMAQAEAIEATAVLPRDASDAQILFTAKQMVGAGRAAPRRPALPPAAVASAREAAAAFGDMFEAARRGRPIAPASLEQGAGAVMAGVGGGRIGAWLDVVRSYDDVTYQHCLLVAGLAAGFAARLGVTVKGQRLIAQAALVHDIGKAAIPHAVLNKAGPLSPSEAEVMRTHPQVGYDMLVRQGGFDPQLLDIVRHHHEYVDGSGYPDALGGEKVSPLTRLVTICDIYAALIERRPYKAPKPPRDALAALVAMGGKLDAGLLRSFHGLVGAG
ncbi:HD-GYP domain-containing protein [Lichenibacterium dinghuense]|uniref:HD-GYP domain-containing protein n=1 Tax=Lichenibacterium dinghuense TaxID=2895977 RepID=UPI001F270D53|nr:HD domain-containing phosphohydrolase [Lichenibacterium sp. 6Y81]